MAYVVCLNCGSGDLTAYKLGIPTRPQTGRKPETEMAVVGMLCNQCGFIGAFGEAQFKATQN